MDMHELRETTGGAFVSNIKFDSYSVTREMEDGPIELSLYTPDDMEEERPTMTLDLQEDDAILLGMRLIKMANPELYEDAFGDEEHPKFPGFSSN